MSHLSVSKLSSVQPANSELLLISSDTVVLLKTAHIWESNAAQFGSQEFTTLHAMGITLGGRENECLKSLAFTVLWVCIHLFLSSLLRNISH